MVTGSLTIKSGVSHLSWESWSFIGISGWKIVRKVEYYTAM